MALLVRAWEISGQMHSHFCMATIYQGAEFKAYYSKHLTTQQMLLNKNDNWELEHRVITVTNEVNQHTTQTSRLKSAFLGRAQTFYPEDLHMKTIWEADPCILTAVT